MRVDVAIAGNGVIGLSIAEALLEREPTLSLAIIGPTSRPGGASRAAGAMLGCFGEVTKDTQASEPSRLKFALSVEAHRRWPDRLERLRATAAAAGETLHHVMGTHVILNSRSGELDSLNFAALVETLATTDEPWAEVDPTAVPGLNPLLDARPLRALSLPGEGAVDSNQVLDLLERRLEKSGVQFVDSVVERIAVADDAASGVMLPDGRTIKAGKVVVAAGSRTADLLRTVLPPECVLPIFAGSGIAFVGRRVMGDPFETVVRTPNRSGACGLHIVPLGSGREYYGATNVLFAQAETSPYVGVGHFVSQCAMEQLDQRVFFHRIDEWRMGNRPVTLDTFPAIGWTELDALYTVSGTYRDGFHCSEVLGEHAAAELLGEVAPLDLTLFSPQRAPIVLRDAESAAAEYATHGVAGWFENGVALPRFESAAAIAELFQMRGRHLHEQLGIAFGLPPEICMFLIESRKDPAIVDEVGAYLGAVAPRAHR